MTALRLPLAIVTLTLLGVSCSPGGTAVPLSATSTARPTETAMVTPQPSATASTAPSPTVTWTATPQPSRTASTVPSPTVTWTATPQLTATPAATRTPTVTRTRQAATVTKVNPTPLPIASGSCVYIGNASSKVFHRPDCSSVKEMSEKNRVCLASRDQALAAGFRPCGRCKP